jgi:hypothetical protein
MNRNIKDFNRGINAFIKRRTISASDGNVEVEDLCHLLNAHVVNGVSQAGLQTTEPSVCEPKHFKVLTAIHKWESCKSSDIFQIPGEVIQAGRK